MYPSRFALLGRLTSAAAPAATRLSLSSTHRLTQTAAVRTCKQQQCAFSAAPVKASTALIKQLRESSGAPITECRDALQGVLAEGKTDGSDAAVMQAAVEWLRKKGISTAAKKSGRAASEGLVGVTVSASGRTGSLVEVNSETDFAARNTLFKQLCAHISGTASTVNGVTLESLQSTSCVDATGGADVNVATAVTNVVSNLRENILLRRATGVAVNNGVVGSYMHNAVDLAGLTVSGSTKLGRQGSLLAIETSAPLDATQSATLASLANKLAMHVVASTPRFISRADVSADMIAQERAVLTEQAQAPPIHVPGQVVKKATKPKDPKQIEKMVEGRINKWLGEIVLLDQPIVVSGDWDMSKPPTVGTVLADTGKALGTDLKVTGMARFLVGEGVVTNKSGDSFAKEVAEKLAKASQ